MAPGGTAAQNHDENTEECRPSSHIPGHAAIVHVTLRPAPAAASDRKHVLRRNSQQSFSAHRPTLNSGGRDDYNRSSGHVVYRFAELWNEPAQVAEPCIECFDYDNTDCEPGHILLILHSLICSDKDVEYRRRVAKKVPVLQARPAFLLNSSDRELRQIAPKLSRHVLIEEDSSHAI